MFIKTIMFHLSLSLVKGKQPKEDGFELKQFLVGLLENDDRSRIP